MAHSHHDHHHHTEPLKAINNAFIIGIIINLVFVVVEVVYGLYIHSLSLLSDAGHNLTDVGTLALSLLAFKLLKVKPTKNYTYGYRKTSIIIALFNAMILMVSIGAIVYEAFHRILEPQSLPGKTIAIVAGIGILINGGSALLFLKNKEKDLNIKSAYLHLLADALVSFALVVGGIIIFYTSWFWIDAVMSILVAITIFISSWSLLRDSLRLSLDGVPVNISLETIEQTALKVKGVKEIHHIHIWGISTTENALTAHVSIDENTSQKETEQIKKELKHEFEHLNIQHITLEMETEKCRTAELQNCGTVESFSKK